MWLRLQINALFSKRFILGNMLCLLAFGLLWHHNFAGILLQLYFLIWLITGAYKSSFKSFKLNLQLPFIAIYIIAGLSLLYTNNMPQGLQQLELWLAFLAFPFLVNIKDNQRPQLRKNILFSFVIGCLFSTVICLVYRSFMMYNRPIGYDIVYFYTYDYLGMGLGIQPIYFAMYLAFASLILQVEKHILGKYTLWVILYFSLYIVMLSSRTEIMVYLLLTVTLRLFQGYSNGKMLPAVLQSAIVASLFLALIYLNPMNRARFAEMVDLQANYTENKWGGRSIRIEKWKHATALILQHPIIGLAPGDTQDALQASYKQGDFELAYINKFNAHNQYLQTLLGLGLLGLGLLFWLFFVLGKWFYTQQDYAALLFLALFVLSCITESMLERQKGVIFLTFFASIFAFLPYKLKSTHASSQ